jgi:hypothetical protein
MKFTMIANDGSFGFNCDINEVFGKACVIECDGEKSLQVNDKCWKVWPKSQWPFVRRVKWSDKSSVALWVASSPADKNLMGAILMSEFEDRFIDVGPVSDIFFSERYIYVTYSEDSILSSSPGEYEFNIMSIFLNDGSFVCGLEKMLRGRAYEGTMLEVSAACVVENALVFLAYHTPYIWMVNAGERDVRTLRLISSRKEEILCIQGTRSTLFLLRYGDGSVIIEKVDIATGRSIGSDSFALHELFGVESLDGKAPLARGFGASGFLIYSGSRVGTLYPDR